MNNIEKYDIWFTIRIVHEYYDNGNCPVALTPSRETISFFKRNGIIYKMTGYNRWVLLTQPKDFSLASADTLCFEMIPQDNTFYYVTELPQIKDNKDYMPEKNLTMGKWMNILIPFGYVKKEIDIELKTKFKYWEFIIIPRYTVDNTTLRIAEKRNRITFGDMEEISFPGVEKAFRVSTIGKNKIKETPEYVVRLYETKSNGERLLSGNIPLPRPDELSVTHPEDTLTTYFYI